MTGLPIKEEECSEFHHVFIWEEGLDNIDKVFKSGLSFVFFWVLLDEWGINDNTNHEPRCSQELEESFDCAEWGLI
jgi:hypothetical protein